MEGPIRIVSELRPQLQVQNKESKCLISVSDVGATISGTDLHIPEVTIARAIIERADVHTLRALVDRATYQYEPVVTISARDLRSVITIVSGIAGDPQYTIVLPIADDVIRDQELTQNHCVLFEIINCTSVSANVIAAGAPLDVISPLDDHGAIVIPPHSSAQITAVLMSTIIGHINYQVSAIRGDDDEWQRAYTVAPSCDALPVVGDYNTLYCINDQNILARWVDSARGYDWSIGPYACDDFPTLQAALASPLVVNGNKLKIRNGVYSIASTLVIAKEVIIFGESREYTVLRSIGASSDPTTLIQINASNVAMCELTIGHYRTSSSASDTAISVTGNRTNIYFDSVNIAYVETGATINASGWVFNHCAFMYRGTASNSIFAGIIMTGLAGAAYVVNCTFDNTRSTTGSGRLVSATSITISGALYFEGNVSVGRVTEIIYFYSVLGAAIESFTFSLKNNSINELNAIVQMRSNTSGFGNMFAQFIASGNRFSNTHGTGIFHPRSISGTRTFRTIANPLPIHAFGNVLTNVTIPAGYVQAIGSSGNLCIYSTTQISPAFTCIQDTIIPPTIVPACPTLTPISEYVPVKAVPQFAQETFVLAGAPDLVSITLSARAVLASLNVFKDRALMYNIEEYTAAVVGIVTVISWVGSPVSVGNKISCRYCLQ